MGIFKENLNRDIFFLLILLVVGIALLYPIHHFQIYLSHDDHGNNLYAAWQTLQGRMPYRDYWWPYGPLMPYYYGALMGLLGENIHSVLMGYRTLHFLCGVVFYFALKRFFVPYMALAAAVFFWVFNVQIDFTYNHTGGILMILLIVYGLISYVRAPKRRYLYVCLGGISLLSLIKLNMGMFMWAGFLIALYATDRICQSPSSGHKRPIYFVTFVGLPALAFGVYWFFMQGLPFYGARQSFLCFDLHPPVSSVWNIFKYPAVHYSNRLSRQGLWWIYALFLFSAVWILLSARRRKISGPDTRKIAAILIILGVFMVFSLHEYWASGVNYTMLWAEPLGLLLAFFLIFFAMEHYPKAIRVGLVALIFGSAVVVQLQHVHRWQSQKKRMDLPRGQIYAANENRWVETVTQVTEFLNNNLGAQEEFLAIPRIQIYYFLTGRRSPVTLTDFTVPIPRAQESLIVQELQSKKVRFILLSNESRDLTLGRRRPGETPCLLLKDYIRTHYRPFAVFGEWGKDPNWLEHHSVMVFKRIED